MSKKSISANAIFNVIYKLLNALFPLVTATYVSRVILPDGVGKVSYAQNIVMYFTYIAALGLPTYGTKEIAKSREKECTRNRIFTELFTINFISTTICAVVYYSVVFCFPFFANNRNLFYVTGLAIILNYINVDWVYQGFEEFKYIAVRSIVIKTLSVIAIFAFIRNESDFIIYALIHCLAAAGNYVFNIVHLRKYIKLEFKGIKIAKHLKPLITLLTASIAIELYTLLDTTMLGFSCPDEVVGYYTNAMKTVKIVITILVGIISVMLPRLSWYFENKEIQKFNALTSNVIKVLFIITVPSAVGVFALSSEIMPVLFGDAFIPAITTLKILCFLLIPIPFSTLFGTQILCAINQEKKMLVAVIGGAISNIAMNAVLIPKFQENGAAIASIISEFLVLFIEILYLRSVLHLDIKPKFYFSCMLSVISMLLTIFIVKAFDISNILTLLLSVVCGGLSYLLFMFVLKNDGIMVFYNLLKTKRKNNKMEV